MALLCVFRPSHAPTFGLAGSSVLHWQNVFGLSEAQGTALVWEGRVKKIHKLSPHSLHIPLLHWSLKAIFFLWEAFSNLCTVSTHLISHIVPTHTTLGIYSRMTRPPLAGELPLLEERYDPPLTPHKPTMQAAPIHSCWTEQIPFSPWKNISALLYSTYYSYMLYAIFFNVHMLPSISAKTYQCH